MSKSSSPEGPAEPPAPPAEPSRAERQAAALRANLRRRKAQARGREGQKPPEPGES